MSKPLLILSALLALAGCNFVSPLTGKPTREVDPSLLGSWFSLADGKPLEVCRLSREEYLVLDDGAPFVCTHSDLAGASFVSCRQIRNDKDSYGKFAYVAYKMENGDLILRNLSEALKIDPDLPAPERRRLIEEAVKSGNALDSDSAHERRFKKKA